MSKEKEIVLEVTADGKTEQIEVAKIKVVRQSGAPVDMKDLDKYRKEWKDGFDAIYAKDKDMSRVQEETAAFQEKMNKKYDTIIEWDMLKTEEEWKNTVAEYGSILVSTHKDTGELMYVIMDMGI
jgi:hypothetical protein